MSEDSDYSSGYDNGCAETAAELRGTVSSKIESGIESRNRQIQILRSEVETLEALKFEILDDLK